MAHEDQGTYEAPQIVYEGDLEIRAGSPQSVGGSLDEFDELMEAGR